MYQTDNFTLLVDGITKIVDDLFEWIIEQQEIPEVWVSILKCTSVKTFILSRELVYKYSVNMKNSD